MKNNLYTIGQVSRIKGITIKALRFYEKIGLIKPFYVDAVTKYRFYSRDQLIQLDLIRALRSIEVSPKNMLGILEKRDTGQLIQYLDDQKKHVLEKIVLLHKTIKIIEQAQNTINNSISLIANQEIVTRAIPERYILTQKMDENLNEEKALVQFSRFPVIIEENDLLDTYETGFYCTPDETGEIHASLLYNAVTTHKNSNKALLSTIPAGEYLCICFNSNHPLPPIAKLNEYLRQNKIQSRLILQVNLLHDVFATDTQYCETQVLL
jgi:MerR family transcriptional regulator, activator of bmr gene